MKHLLVLLISIGFAGCTQDAHKCKVCLTIEDAGVSLSRDNPAITLKIRLENNSRDDLVIYGINSTPIYNTSEDDLCNPEKVGVGICFLIYDDQNKRIRSEFQFHPNGYEKITEEIFIERMGILKDQFLTQTQVLRVGKEISAERTVGLDDLHLKPGQYQLQAIYFSGKGLYDNFVAGIDQVKSDEEKHRASVFQGCARSNFVSFTVE